MHDVAVEQITYLHDGSYQVLAMLVVHQRFKCKECPGHFLRLAHFDVWVIILLRSWVAKSKNLLQDSCLFINQIYLIWCCRRLILVI